MKGDAANARFVIPGHTDPDKGNHWMKEVFEQMHQLPRKWLFILLLL